MGKFDGLAKAFSGVGSLFKKKSSSPNVSGILNSIPNKVPSTKPGGIEGIRAAVERNKNVVARAQGIGSGIGNIAGGIAGAEGGPAGSQAGGFLGGILGRRVGSVVGNNIAPKPSLFSRFRLRSYDAVGSANNALNRAEGHIQRFPSKLPGIFAFLILVAGAIYSFISGILPLNAWYTWAFIIVGIFFVLASMKGLTGMMFLTGGIMFYLILFHSQIFTAGALAGKVQSPDGVEFANFGDITKDVTKNLKCTYHNSIDPENPKPECVGPVVDVDEDEQEETKDIVLSFGAEPNRIIEGQTVLLNVNLRNDGSEQKDVDVNISYESNSGGEVDIQLAEGFEPDCNDGSASHEVGYFCKTVVPAAGERTLTLLYKVNEAPSGAISFTANASYESVLLSSLLLTTTDNIQEKRKQILSKATAGYGDLILAAQNQPLYKGDTFQFAFNIKNNDKNKGAIKDPDARVFIPKDIVDVLAINTNGDYVRSCVNKNGIDVVIERECNLDNSDEDYFCLSPVDSLENPRMDIIKESEEFYCNFKVNSDLGRGLSRTAHGRMNYGYDLSESAGIVVD